MDGFEIQTLRHETEVEVTKKEMLRFSVLVFLVVFRYHVA